MDIYIIADKILRANNLQYKNWRIGFNLEKDVINAVSLNNNLIIINSSLYDCIHQNKDALAYVIAHELAHFVLSHQKITIENTYKIKKLEHEIKRIEDLKQANAELFSRNLKNLTNNIYYNQRQLELNADSEALSMLLRAGYNLDLALELFDYIDEDWTFYENKNIYPLIYERKENLYKTLDILDIDALFLEGQRNLYLSDVLSVQKSMDKETLVINKPNDYKKYSYNLISKNQKILNKAYLLYKKDKIDEAVKYFLLAADGINHIAPLYLSYCCEKQNNLKLAKRYIRKAKQINPKDEAVILRYKSLYKK